MPVNRGSRIFHATGETCAVIESTVGRLSRATTVVGCAIARLIGVGGMSGTGRSILPATAAMCGRASRDGTAGADSGVRTVCPVAGVSGDTPAPRGAAGGTARARSTRDCSGGATGGRRVIRSGTGWASTGRVLRAGGWVTDRLRLASATAGAILWVACGRNERSWPRTAGGGVLNISFGIRPTAIRLSQSGRPSACRSSHRVLSPGPCRSSPRRPCRCCRGPAIVRR